ncbi:uncharacterized protein [Antedon mediterranea]|uniref:uncharacterized protein n=1 Tax=Antedon mediterranea TaxID=105859 RepID=UPI003AF52CA4
MDGNTEEHNVNNQGLNIQLGRELETCSRDTSPDTSSDAITSQLSRLSINISAGNRGVEICGIDEADGAVEESTSIHSRQMHNSNHSFYSDCISKRKTRQERLNVNLVRLKPHVSISINTVNENHSRRSVNENLNSYMVIRQRTFHGFPRTRREMKTLPLTDPRDSASYWLHRSKTDLFIERRREKFNNQKRSESQTGLNGMTFGYLVENLPRSHSSGHVASSSSSRQRSLGNFSARSCPPDFNSDRLPPLSRPDRTKQFLKADFIESQNSSHCESSTKKIVRRNKLSSTCLPLKVWEPSLDVSFMLNKRN